MNRNTFDPDKARGARTDTLTKVDARTEELASRAIGAAIDVHKALGPGFDESVYQKALSVEMNLQKIPHACESGFRVQYKGCEVGHGRIDMLIDETLILELKAVDALMAVHESQLVAYLKAKQLRLGLLMNFNVQRLNEGLKRVIL